MRWFKLPTPEQMKEEELLIAQRALLNALSAKEYADAMVTYNTQRVKRLSADVSINDPQGEK